MKKVVIDAGHGGNDGGATGNGIVEKELTLKISEYIHKRLDELGIENKMVRVSDETIEPNERVRRILELYGNNSDVLVISNHINASGTGNGEGTEIIYALRNNDNFSKRIADELEKTGRYVRKYYQRRYPGDSSKDYYFIHRNTGNTEAVIVEYGFLDNKNDATLLKNNWEKYAEAVVKAIASYVGVKYDSKEEVSGEKVYIVKKGDTLWSIANKYGLSVQELKDINNLSSNMLSIGQKLLLSKNTTDIYYVVGKGDTLYSIAKQYGISVDELKKINNLTSDNISIGQKLLVSNDMNDIIKTDYDLYIVKNGDTLWSIATKNNTSVDKLKDINNLSSNMLSIGQKLLIPKNSDKNNKQYVVKKGDTLYSIAKNNKTTVTDIINLNNLSSVDLAIGQKILIP